MGIASTLDRLHSQAKQNRWLWLFSIFNRLALALGFIPAGLVKIMDERFASGLHARHPMGHYLEALHQTGYYYWFIGIVQLAAAIMLLIPRTVTLGAFLYFPIILNITILTYATRFDGSLFTAPLMTLANLFILGWNYEKWKYILPFNRLPKDFSVPDQTIPESDFPVRETAGNNFVFSIYTRLRNFLTALFNDKFPALFFAGVLAATVVFVIVVPQLYSVKPRNTFDRCMTQFKNGKRTVAGNNFCKCIHDNGETLNKCLSDYDNAPDDSTVAP